MKKTINRLFEGIKKTIIHFGFISLIIIPVFVILNVVLFTVRGVQNNIIERNLYTEASSELNNINVFLETEINGFHEDMHIVEHANEMQDYLINPTPEHALAYELMFSRVMSSKLYMKRLILIDQMGHMTYEVKRDDAQNLITSDTNLGSINLEDYYEALQSFSVDYVYISNIHLEDQFVISFIKPLFVDTDIVGYIYIDFSIDNILDVIARYESANMMHIKFGLLNEPYMWISQMDDSVTLVEDQHQINDVLTAIEEDPYTIFHIFNFDDQQNHYVVDSSNQIYMFASIDKAGAVANSGYILNRYPWIIALFNLATLFGISYLALAIRKKNENLILLNANIYLSEKSSEAVVITDHQMRVTYINDTFTDLFGYRKDEIYEQSLYDYVGLKNHLPILDTHIQNEYEYFNWSRTKSGIYLLSHLRMKSEHALRKSQRHYIFVYSEPRIELEDFQKYFVKKESTLIALQSLLNHQDFDHKKTTAIMIRVEDTDVNAFAYYLRMHLDPTYMVMRIQYHYLLIYANIEANHFQQAINQIDMLIERYRYFPYVSREFSFLYVISRVSEHTKDLSSLLDHLLITLEIARKSSKYKYLIYTPQMQYQIEREKEIRNALDQAFVNDEFYINYQLQMNMKNKTYSGVEALLRWQSESLGNVGPSEFIPVIEDSYYINQLSRTVLKNVIKDFTPYVTQLPKTFRIAINMTAFDFNDEDLIMEYIDMIEASLLRTNQFTFEITEGHYIDNLEKTNRIINILHAKDILVAIDDFGTGYSSINSLKSLRVDYIKIDRSFIKDYPEKDNGDMLKTMINLIHGLNKTVVVEGTETHEHIKFCTDNHCQYIQGYFINKPVDIKEMMHQFLDPKKPL